MERSVYIHPAEARRRFEEFASSEIHEEDLALGALLVALEEYPRLDVDACLDVLDDIASRAIKRIGPAEPDVFWLGHLHAELFDVEGFEGNLDDYYDIRNSYLNEVIERKKGLPITLSIIYLYIARKMRLQAFGVGLPGHFIVKIQFDLSELYIDPFYDGRTLTVPEIGKLVAEMSGRRIQLQSEHLRRYDPRETLIRLHTNLQQAYTRLGDEKRARGAAERIQILNRKTM